MKFDLTIAVPLYQSARFVENIVDNLRRCAPPNTQILISDRHGLDDAIDCLRGELGDGFGENVRVFYVSATDGIGWVAHYNELLTLSDAPYFSWMPHDDSYDDDYFSRLLTAMRENPTAPIAFGRMEAREADSDFSYYMPEPPVRFDGAWTAWHARRCQRKWTIGYAFRGVFGRMDDGKFLPLRVREGIPTAENLGKSTLPNTDQYWVFSRFLAGRPVYIPEANCRKFYQKVSAHRSWPIEFQPFWPSLVTVWRYIGDAKLSWRERIPTYVLVTILWINRYRRAGFKIRYPEGHEAPRDSSG